MRDRREAVSLFCGPPAKQRLGQVNAAGRPYAALGVPLPEKGGQCAVTGYLIWHTAPIRFSFPLVQSVTLGGRDGWKDGTQAV